MSANQHQQDAARRPAHDPRGRGATGAGSREPPARRTQTRKTSLTTKGLTPCRAYHSQIKTRLIRDHEVANLLSRIEDQSKRGLKIYNDEQDARTQEIQQIGTGDPFEEFYKQLDNVKQFHKKYPQAPVENLERIYKNEFNDQRFSGDIDAMFTGEEGYGRFFDLTLLHEEYLNLPGVKGVKRITYLQYLDIFDIFTPPKCPIKRQDKITDEFFAYVGSLAQYLESFMRRIKPLENLDRLFAQFDKDFETAWEEGTIPGWEKNTTQPAPSLSSAPQTQGTGEGIWCADCEKDFKNDNVYKAHLTGKKHIKAASAKKTSTTPSTNGNTTTHIPSAQTLKEKAVAAREHRIQHLAAAMQTERSDTRVNVERKAGMTDRERQQELAAMYEEDALLAEIANNGKIPDDFEEDDEEGGEKLYNPLKLPLAWDGKPIPFWLYKLHGLGVEFGCEICGNYVYMGRRAFEKHFTEGRHVYGLKCLGITQTGMFREITKIDEAERLWEKIQRDKREKVEKGEGVVEMEDGEGNVMPLRVWQDLEKQGLL